MTTLKTARLSLAFVFGLACAAAVHSADKPVKADYKIGDTLPAPAASAAQTKPAPAATPAAPATGPGTPTAAPEFKLINWDALLPKDWDPLKEFKNQNLGLLGDNDPRAREALEKLKRVLDTAPSVPALDKQKVRIAGFVVPLDGEADNLREFLLVPYFGACIHVPPPPANQIIHVKSARPIKNVRTMDAVWVSGTVQLGISDTGMGTSAYRMSAEIVAPYKEPR